MGCSFVVSQDMEIQMIFSLWDNEGEMLGQKERSALGICRLERVFDRVSKDVIW